MTKRLVACVVGLLVGLTASVATGSGADCQASAELHYAISGGQDAAYEDALEACNNGWTYAAWLAYEPSACEEYAGAAYDQTGDSSDYEVAYHACIEALESR